jgi:hypothetical protein
MAGWPTRRAIQKDGFWRVEYCQKKRLHKEFPGFPSTTVIFDRIRAGHPGEIFNCEANDIRRVSLINNRPCVLTFCLSVLMGAFAFAQQSAPATPAKQMTAEETDEANIQLMRQDIRSERKKIVAASLPLTESEATKFWPVYDRYIGETIKVNDVRFALIKEYAANYKNMTDEQAGSFIRRWLALDQDNSQLRVKFIPEFEKVISPTKTAMFMQIDRRLAMLIELQLASQVPVVQP